MPNILITGGVGFIGINAAKLFADKGWNVTVFDSFARKGVEVNEKFLKEHYKGKVKIIKGDVRTRLDLVPVVENQDVVLHLAAQAAVTTSVIEPWGDFKANTLGTLRVLEAVRLSSGNPIVIYTSTNKVYGALEDVEVVEKETRYAFADGRSGVTEKEQLDFHSPYGCSKGAADQYVHDYARLYDMKTVVFRQSCIYGPHQMGMEDQGWVAWFLIAAMFGMPATIYGNGKQVRDLLHVDDVVSLYEKSIENIDSASGQVYNIGGGPTNTLSLLEFMEYLNGDLGMNLQYAFSETRPGDQPIFISDNSKAKADIGWEPTIEAREGISQLKQWLMENRASLEKYYEEKKGVVA